MVRNLWDALGEIEDRRGRRGRHSELRSILGIAVGAMLAGSNDLLSIFRWGRRLKPEALKLFGIARGRAPCHATYHYFFQGLDGDALSRALGRFARGADAPEHIAIDGKTLRRDEAKLRQMSASRIGQHGALTNQQFPPTVHEQRGLLLSCLHWNEAHRRPLAGFADRLGVGGVILVALDVGFHILRRHKAHLMSQRPQARATSTCAVAQASLPTRHGGKPAKKSATDRAAAACASLPRPRH